MGTQPDPLVQFSERLYFTTFHTPIPSPNILNDLKTQPKPKVRSRTRFAAQVPTPDDHATYYFFTLDDDLPYMSFFEDWGPLNLGQVYKACILIHELLEDKELKPHRLCLYSSSDPRRKANAALIMALFVMIVQRRQPWEAFHPIAEMEFMPFRDAGRGRSDFNLSIQDCLWGFWKATHYGLCDLNEFSIEEYEYYEKVENGDWNWITPHFIAFASPVDTVWMKQGGASQSQNASQAQASQATNGTQNASQPPLSARSTSSSSSTSGSLQRRLPTPYVNCLEYFAGNRVRTIVRLNNPLYDKNTFIDRGFEHIELYFDDGTNPTDEIVRQFLEIADKNIEAGGVVAVHCKAGLGRTGTLIGAYLIYKYGFTANEAIAFMRIARPGCVVGPQQQYMYTRQLEWLKWAAIDEHRKAEQAKKINRQEAITPPMDDDGPNMVIDQEPVTPPRKSATTDPLVPQTLEPPGQPRKTPATKRIITKVDEDDESDEREAADIITALEPAASKATTTVVASGRTTPTNGRGRVGAPPRQIRQPTSERTSRTTRSTTRSTAPIGAVAKRTAIPPRAAVPPRTTAPPPAASSGLAQTRATAKVSNPAPIPSTSAAAGVRTRAAAAAAASAGVSYKIPRLAANHNASASTSTVGNARTRPLPANSRGPGRAPSPSPASPSRLPKMVPRKRAFGAPHGPLHSMSDTNTRTLRKVSGGSRSRTGSVVDSKSADGGDGGGRSGGGDGDESEKLDPDAWINGEAAGSVVTLGSKSERPGLRSVKRRRSSFSSADVVA